ncbi:sulfatase [Thermodesulfobacteriota bacterium]
MKRFMSGMNKSTVNKTMIMAILTVALLLFFSLIAYFHIRLDKRIDKLAGNVDTISKDISKKFDKLSANANYIVYNRQRASGEREYPNVILILNDALRGDCLGFNGYRDISTPNLDRFAARCINFRNAISQSGHTAPSITSILTGLYPIEHQVFDRHRVNKLKQSATTIQAVLRLKGYFTAAYVGSNVRKFREALNRGFYYVSVSKDSKGEETLAEVFQFLQMNNHSPYFLLIHIFDPHSPYAPSIPPYYPEELSRSNRRKLEEGVDVSTKTPFSKINFLNYKREIEELDDRYGRLFDFLFNSPKSLFDKNKDIIIFTADHGEEFPHENGYYHHGRSPYIETIRVPLLFYIPSYTPTTVNRYVENASIFPTILELLGFGKVYIEELALSTTSLLEFLSAPKKGGKVTYVLSEAIAIDTHVPEHLEAHESKTLVRSDGYKLIYDTMIKQSRLFHLKTDPLEEKDLSNLKGYQPILRELFEQLDKKTNLLYDYRDVSEMIQ